MTDHQLCDNLKFTTTINAIAVATASQFQSADEQIAVATVLTQIADTIETIAARNTLCEKKRTNHSVRFYILSSIANNTVVCNAAKSGSKAIGIAARTV